MASSSETDKVIKLLSEAFPDIRCLRCGHDQFLVATDVNVLAGRSGDGQSVLALQNAIASPDQRNVVMTLVCERCGHLEHHMTGPLARAKRPIKMES